MGHNSWYPLLWASGSLHNEALELESLPRHSQLCCALVAFCRSREARSPSCITQVPRRHAELWRMGQLDEGTSPYCEQGTWFLATSPIPGLLLSVCWLKMTPNFMASWSEFGIIWYYCWCFCRLVGLIRAGLFLCSCYQRRLGCTYLRTWWGGTFKMHCPHGWQGRDCHWSMSVWPPRGFGLSQDGGWAPSGSDRRMRDRSCRTSIFLSFNFILEYRTNPQKWPFHYRGWNTTVGSQETPGVTGKFG